MSGATHPLPLAGADELEWRVSPGLTRYPAALAEMEARAAAIRAGEAGELIWLLEHPPLYTAGTSADPAELFNPELNPQPHRDIRFSQEEIGRLCGLSRQVASRALHRLEQEGLVNVRHGGIQVLDVAGLRRFVTLH